MTRTSYALSAYQAARRTVPPLQAVVMLYDTVLLRVGKAAAAARARDWETQFKEVLRAAEIFNGLAMILDHEQGGAVARSLREMYETTCRALLSSVGRKSGAACLERIAAAVRPMRNAWAEVAATAGAPEPPRAA
jgi:flagellar protein FliS